MEGTTAPRGEAISLPPPPGYASAVEYQKKMKWLICSIDVPSSDTVPVTHSGTLKDPGEKQNSVIPIFLTIYVQFRYEIIFLFFFLSQPICYKVR